MAEGSQHPPRCVQSPFYVKVLLHKRRKHIIGHRRNPNISVCELYGKLWQEKAYSITVTMTHRQNWAKNGKWMWNMCLRHVMWAQMVKNSISIPCWRKPAENGLSTYTEKTAAIPQWTLCSGRSSTSGMLRMRYRQTTAESSHIHRKPVHTSSGFPLQRSEH